MTEAGHGWEEKIESEHTRKEKLPNRKGLKHVALTNKKQEKQKNNGKRAPKAINQEATK